VLGDDLEEPPLVVGPAQRRADRERAGPAQARGAGGAVGLEVAAHLHHRSAAREAAGHGLVARPDPVGPEQGGGQPPSGRRARGLAGGDAEHGHPAPSGLGGEDGPERGLHEHEGPRARLGEQRREAPGVVGGERGGGHAEGPRGPHGGLGLGGHEERGRQVGQQGLDGGELAEAGGVQPQRAWQHRGPVEAEALAPVGGGARVGAERGREERERRGGGPRQQV
jgi:hypothetical protein